MQTLSGSVDYNVFSIQSLSLFLIIYSKSVRNTPRILLKSLIATLTLFSLLSRLHYMRRVMARAYLHTRLKGVLYNTRLTMWKCLLVLQCFEHLSVKRFSNLDDTKKLAKENSAVKFIVYLTQMKVLAFYLKHRKVSCKHGWKFR